MQLLLLLDLLDKALIVSVEPILVLKPVELLD